MTMMIMMTEAVIQEAPGAAMQEAPEVTMQETPEVMIPEAPETVTPAAAAEMMWTWTGLLTCYNVIA